VIAHLHGTALPPIEPGGALWAVWDADAGRLLPAGEVPVLSELEIDEGATT
jgi:hypothetical protein